MVTELNEREKPERNLRERPDALADIIGSAMDAIIAVDDAQRIVLFNAAAEKMFCCPADEAMGNSVKRFIPQRFRAGHSTRVRHFDKSGVTNRSLVGLGTLWGLRATGEEFPIEASISKVESAGKKYFTAVIRDITERKRSEEILRRSEERFRLAAQAGRMFAYEWDAATDLITRSPESAQILGINEAVPITGQQALAKVHPDDGERVKAAVAALNPQKPYLHVTYRMIRPNKTVIWVERSSCAQFDEQGKLLRIIGMVADITERHRAEEAVRESEQRFRLVADTAPALIWMSGTDKLCNYFNKPWLDFTGRSMEQELGNGWAEGVHPNDLRRCLDIYTQSFDRREKFKMEHRLRHRDGEYRWILDIGVPRLNQDGSFAGYIGIGVDVTDRKHAEHALRESEERLRLAQQAARLGTFEWNIRTGVNTWTLELEGIYGLPPGGFAGTQAAFVNLIHSDDREGVLKLVDESLKTAQTTRGEWRVVWPDGSVHWIAGSWRVFMNESGEPSRVIGVNGDITERKRAEQELSKANERLHLSMEAGGAAGWDYDFKTGKDIWFGNAHAQLGMTRDEILGSRKGFWDRVHEDDRKRVEHALQVAKEKREDFAEDVRVVWRDGTTHWLRSRGRFQYAANGEAERWLGISLDITERKMAEDRLREYAEAVEGAEDIIGVIDRQYRLLLANRQYLKMRNLTREQVVGHFASELFNKEMFETVIKPKLDECFQGKVVRYEMKFSYPTVGERDLSLSYFPIQGVKGVDRVACILRDITDRKRAEEALLEMNRTLEAQGSLLRSREELLRVFVKNVPAAVAMLDRDMRYLQVSDRWCTDYLPGRAEILGRSHNEIFPDMPERWKEVHRRALQGETLRADEDRWDGQDGTHWARWEVRPWKTAEGAVGGILILAEDITRRKQMEEALSDLSRKLIESQEQERARIGRELHDDINQRLAMVSLELEQLQENPSEIQPRVKELRRQMAEVSNDVQALSHDLHSSKLEYLGVVAGMKSWCKELAERQKMEIDFSSDVPSALPLEVGLSLFRVLQEALHNVIKHSGVRRVEIQLREDSSEIHLVISDSGRGFDPEAASQGRGLGLTSMRERVRLVNGTITIESTPMGGTTIHIRVPFRLEHGSERAAG